MAAKTQSAKPSFYEVVFQGKPKVVRAFLHGLTMGTDGEASLFFSFTDGIAHEGKVERLAEKVGLKAAGCHVVMDAATAARVKSLAKRIARETGLEVSSHRRVKSASMAFSWHAYTPQHDAEILKALRNLPDGVKLSGMKHEVKADPSSRGVEAYAPAHHYEAIGGGTVSGAVDALVALRHRVETFPLVTLEDIELALA